MSAQDQETADYLDLIRGAYAAGRADAEREMAAAWNRAAAPAARGGPDRDEIEKRRWGPAGREHFADPRPSDFPGLNHLKEREMEAG